MTVSTLSSKNQTTLKAEFVRKLNLGAGARFKQSLEKGRIVLEPIHAMASAYGSLKSKRKFVSIRAETEAMERAAARHRGKRPRRS
jgi:hypothetical protein